MNVVLGFMGALGGMAVFTAAVWALLRGLIRQSDAVKANTKATDALTDSINRLNSKVNDHGIRLALLEDWRKGGNR